jgi:hypothetical protein
VLVRAMSKDSQACYGSAAEMAADLRAIGRLFEDEPGRGPSTGITTEQDGGLRRWWGAAALAAGAAVAWWLWR